MTDNDPRAKLKPPAHVAPYVEVLGVDDAVRFFLACGGTVISLPKGRSSDRSRAALVVGARKVEKLAARLGLDYVKVPIPKPWLAEAMLAQGETIAEIARTLKCDAATIRRWLGPAPRTRQLDLFKT